ncbi:MAG: hypothetical protein HOV79_00535 [Hamadaea sp.]|nr:hypothetical protein [Hamadaea sp.]
MTTVVPALCFACTRLQPAADPDTGTPVVGACTAYPDGVPVAIALGGDHHEQRGDERDGLTFEQADSDDARRAYSDWRNTFGPPQP